MALSRRVARPLLASAFVTAGVDTLRHPDARVKKADPITTKLHALAPAIPDDTELLVKVNAGVQVGAGVLLVVGKAPRLSAAALAASMVPTTLAGHRFWEEVDPVKRQQQQVHFFKNLSILGGLVIAALDTGGAPSLTWRAKRAARRASDLTGVAHDTADAAAGVARGAAKAARRAIPA